MAGNINERSMNQFNIDRLMTRLFIMHSKPSMFVENYCVYM